MVVDTHGGAVAHAELVFGNAMIMLGTARSPDGGGYDAVAPPPGSGALYVVVPDPIPSMPVRLTPARKIVRPLADTEYGSREYSARDLEGNVWSFGTYQPWAT
jgi:uncharacterized glyoxalase superfamily protein PhnB